MSEPRIVSDDDIQAFIALFDGDVIAAVHRLRDYTGRMYERPAYHPTGRVIIETRNLKKQYKVGRQKVDALKDASITIHEGEFVALTGASGSGKSTLLQLIGGLDKPTRGTVTVDDMLLTKMSDRKLSRFRGQTIGFVFQFFYLQPFLKVRTNLEVPGMFARTRRADRHEQTYKLAHAVGLDDRLEHLPRELSGGQMQRAAVARALLNNPKILLADEPTGNLDSENGAAIIELFEAIRKEFGTTIVVVTHDAGIAAKADRVIQLRDGVVV